MSAGDGDPTLVAAVDELASQPGVAWSVAVRDVGQGRMLASAQPGRRLPIASVGKLLLLIEVAARFADHTLDPELRLSRRADLAVGDSGLWQHLATEALPARDLAVLVASVSDNLATNVLLDHVGLPAVQRRAETLGLTATRLLDRVRDRRDAVAAAPTLALGTAAELCGLLEQLATGTAVGPEPDATVLDWLRLGVDLSLVGAALGLDPLAHHAAHARVAVSDAAPGPSRTTSPGASPGLDRPLLWSKTGADPGIRADVGLLARGGRRLAYAAVARWDPDDDHRRDGVLAGMHRLGAGLRAALDSDSHRDRQPSEHDRR
jgi:beta-lactamase class A